MYQLIQMMSPFAWCETCRRFVRLNEEPPHPIMNQSPLSRLAFAVLALALAGSLTPLQARTRTARAQGPQGSAERQTVRQNGDVSRTTNWTNAQGQTGTHTDQRAIDPVTRSATIGASTTLPDGRSASRHLDRVKTETGRSATGTLTGFNGNSGTINSTTTRTENGFTRDTVVTGANGKTATTEADFTRQDGTATRVVTHTGFGGKTTTTTQTRSVPPPAALP